tara:strand:- start:79359 stop:80624 length:1266 start_codon:yes stop_codon:yes gene_type:complete
MSDTNIQYLATFFFAVSILHTFAVSVFHKLSAKYPKGSAPAVFFHLMSEVEVVFGFWAIIFVFGYVILKGYESAFEYAATRSYNEPLFVFVIMVVCSSKPVRDFVNHLISSLIKLPLLKPQIIFFYTAFAIAPLLGSFITEPAAMTIIATLVLNALFERNEISEKFKYAILGLLFVNISIGGTLTPYAAPPVLMVTEKWGWDMSFMLTHFGWKAALACFVSTMICFYQYRKSILALKIGTSSAHKSPMWVQLISLVFIGVIVLWHKLPMIFIGIFLAFLVFAQFTRRYQDRLKMKESGLVGFFLAGLVVLGGLQSWWLEPIISRLSSLFLYMSAIALTAVTDNAAITYLGTLVSHLPDESKYALVAGAVVGGGLTVIANAPNPAGYGILNSSFGVTGIKASKLFVAALMPTLVAAAIFWFL